MGLGKTLGIVASLTTIAGFIFFVYDKTHIDPNREQLNRLTDLIETQKEQLLAQKQLVKIFSEENIIPMRLNQENNLADIEVDSNKQKNVTLNKSSPNKCSINNPTHELIVHSVNVRENSPTLGSLAPKKGIIFRGMEYKVIDIKKAGVFGLGTSWYEIEYCNRNNEKKDGWISTKLKDGTPTSKKL